MVNWLDRYAAQAGPQSARDIEVIHHYAEWHNKRGESEFVPGGDDTTAIRTYLLQLRNAGASRDELERAQSALRELYARVVEHSRLTASPFDTSAHHDTPVVLPILSSLTRKG